MQQLTKRLSTVDPEAAEELKVVSYFDALVAGHADAEALVRGAMSLAGVAAGFETPRATLRVDTDGARNTPPAGSAIRWRGAAFGSGGRVWLERDGELTPIDQMIAARLATALSLTLSHDGRDRSPLELLIDPDTPPVRQVDAARRLRLDGASTGRMIARAVGATTPPGSVVVATSVGFVVATYLPSGSPLPSDGAIGIGPVARGLALGPSWRAAVLALRLSEGETVVADDLGALLPLLLAAERDAADHPDVRALSRLAQANPEMITTARVLTNERSVRAASSVLALHPSTVHARATSLGESIGFDPLTADGRLRLALALRLYRLAETRFAPGY